jgi:hypothetical protein
MLTLSVTIRTICGREVRGTADWASQTQSRDARRRQARATVPKDSEDTLTLVTGFTDTHTHTDTAIAKFAATVTRAWPAVILCMITTNYGMVWCGMVPLPPPVSVFCH